MSKHAPYRGSAEYLLHIENLTVDFDTNGTVMQALSDFTLKLGAGEIVGMAGESGSGKSTAALAMMGILSPNARVSGSILYQGRQLIGLPLPQLREIRGCEIAMIFQETVTALNPVVRVGDQLLKAVRAHLPITQSEALEYVKRSLQRVRLNDTGRVLRSYPSELSGGMCQRVLIAMAITCGSKVLLADEPTTALDVSVQHEILALLKDLAGQGIGILLISHDLAVLNEVADQLVVLYAGEVMEQGPLRPVIHRSSHPYSKALLACVPSLRGVHSKFVEIPEGAVDTSVTDTGCKFRTRCLFRSEICERRPSLQAIGAEQQLSRCWEAANLTSDVRSYY